MKKNQLISLSVGIILVILILAAVKLRTISRYRDILPKYPDLTGMTEQLKDQIIDAENLKIPHPLLHERKFVLEPLCEIEADLVHPVLGKNIRDLLAVCKDKSEITKLLAGADL